MKFQGILLIHAASQKSSFQGERITRVLLHGNIMITILGILSESLGLGFKMVLELHKNDCAKTIVQKRLYKNDCTSSENHKEY